jgi:DNA polymerase-1
MSKKTNKKQNKRIIIDADYLLYQATMSNADTGRCFKAEGGDEDLKGRQKATKESKRKYRKRFLELVEEIVDIIACQFAYGVDVKAEPLLVFSDPDSNFRYELYPDYKSNRKNLPDRTPDFYALRKWCHKHYFVAPHLEADDVVAWYKTQGHLIVSVDKDILYGVPGKAFDPKNVSFSEIDKTVANTHLLQQTLAGDSGDGIPGIKGVGMKTASKLLDEFGWDWAGVVKAYESNGMSQEDAILTRRLVGMDQAFPKNKKRTKWKVILFDPENT